MSKDFNPAQKNTTTTTTTTTTLTWDCDSSLYDSFELDSFKRQLDSAMTTRSISMPHISDHYVAKKRSKLSSALHKLLHMISLRLKPKRSRSFPPYISEYHSVGGGHGTYGHGRACISLGGLASIPEASEKGSPEVSSVARRTVSERFTSSTTTTMAVKLKVVL